MQNFEWFRKIFQKIIVLFQQVIMQRDVISMIIYISNKPQYLKNEARYGRISNGDKLWHFKISLKWELKTSVELNLSLHRGILSIYHSFRTNLQNLCPFSIEIYRYSGYTGTCRVSVYSALIHTERVFILCIIYPVYITMQYYYMMLFEFGFVFYKNSECLTR